MAAPLAQSRVWGGVPVASMRADMSRHVDRLIWCAMLAVALVQLLAAVAVTLGALPLVILVFTPVPIGLIFCLRVLRSRLRERSG